ncbi:molybdopterin-dependent oxidoreductase, partial [Intestinimonas massiliensis]|uniref:molybdopterin cofactor-binding domain-containing protein n=1 Tax=Intestinimonas massiliensis (ex Afouda et al. 2020) TaxID=1673721 RepID=UPI00210B0144
AGKPAVAEAASFSDVAGKWYADSAALAGGRTLADVEGVDFHAEYTGITDKLGSPKEHPVSHIAYGYATPLVELDAEGKVARVIAAHDVGRAVNPVSVEGQIE